MFTRREGGTPVATFLAVAPPLNGQHMHKSCLEGERFTIIQTIISSHPTRVCKLEVCKLGVLFVCAPSWQYGCKLSS